jgi:hypothetical protein
VRTWRRLQQLGALPIKQSVYVLPDSPPAREDFEWLRTEIKDKGGDANVFAADSIDPWSDEELVEEFRRTRQESYGALAAEIERALARRRRRKSESVTSRALRVFGERLKAIERIDFFGSAGRDHVGMLLARLETSSRRAASEKPEGRDRQTYQGRLWVTRPRPGVDRMASAWLIRRFIDPQARFSFAPDAKAIAAGDAIPFDMFGVEFTHHGDDCTFETLCIVFGIDDKAVARVGMLVHDLDLKDGRFASPDAPTVGALIEGMQMSMSEDSTLLESGIRVFEAMYRAFAAAHRSPRPRPVVRQRRRREP